MKPLICALFLVLGTTPLMAQETETLIRGDVTYGGYGGPVMKVGAVMDGTGLFTGGRGAWVINFDRMHALHIGGGGYGLTTEHLVEGVTIEDEPRYLAFGYGGLELGYVNNTNRLLHLSAQTLIGAGGATYRERGFTWDRPESTSAAFVLEPGLNAELNLTRFARLNAGISYRWVSGIDLDSLHDSDVSGISGVFSVIFGSF